MSEGQSSAAEPRRCRDIMTRSVATTTPDAEIRAVAALMRESDIGAVPVLDAGKLVGIVTDRDIVVRVIAEGGDASTPISQAMSTELFTVSPDDFVFGAIRLMGERKVRRVPVVGDDGTLAGIIAMADVALEIEDEREIAEVLEEISSGTAFWSKQ